MTQLHERIQAVLARQQQEWLWRCLSLGMILGGSVSCAVGLARLLLQGTFGWGWVVMPVLLTSAIGVVFALLTRRSVRDAAKAIDRACNLKDRTQTALQFLHVRSDEPLRQLQVQDAEAHAATIVPEQVVPIHSPGLWPLAVSLTGFTFILAFLSSPPMELHASEQPNALIEKQSDRLEEELEQLKQLKEEVDNPELEQLVNDLQQMIEQLREPGLDPKEALAKLSEMEASLQEAQQQLDDPQTAADLQQIGEALSLSDAMATAGEALSKGELEKAAEQLEQLEMPKLDRKTEKAVTEKLDKLQQSSQDGQPKSKTQDAASQVSQGLSQGNRSQFQDGMKGLAGEARKRGRRKKLSNLLKKQCQCLSECKSECESECRNQAESKKKGGSKAGTASSGNDPGEKTAKLKTNPEMNIKGQESANGDSEIENVAGDPQEQEAVRAYRDKASDYEAMSESVLESESIPLGHRQTIRKYFEMIRPNGSADPEKAD
ncbi:MAG: hypothetical protein R3C20_01075 [Planctomycetaceae bacterium]